MSQAGLHTLPLLLFLTSLLNSTHPAPNSFFSNYHEEQLPAPPPLLETAGQSRHLSPSIHEGISLTKDFSLQRNSAVNS